MSEAPSWFHDDVACRVTPDLDIVIVKGCASRFVKRVAYQARYRTWIHRDHDVDTLVGTTASGDLLLPIGAGHDRLVALWRDPVERFARAYSEWCIERVPHSYATYAALQIDTTWERFLDFARWELDKGEHVQIVEHLRPQAMTWSREHVSEVWPVEELSARLRREGIALPVLALPVLAGRRRPRPPVPPAPVSAAVRELYAADYELRP